MDIYAETTSRIIDQMESGIIPWEKPWIGSDNAISHTTGKPYSLLNQMLLGEPGEYLTYKQCIQEGGHVRKGEKARMVVFWKFLRQEDEETGEIKEIPYLKYFNVSTSASARASLRNTFSAPRTPLQPIQMQSQSFPRI